MIDTRAMHTKPGDSMPRQQTEELSDYPIVSLCVRKGKHAGLRSGLPALKSMKTRHVAVSWAFSIQFKGSFFYFFFSYSPVSYQAEQSGFPEPDREWPVKGAEILFVNHTRGTLLPSGDFVDFVFITAVLSCWQGRAALCVADVTTWCKKRKMHKNTHNASSTSRSRCHRTRKHKGGDALHLPCMTPHPLTCTFNNTWWPHISGTRGSRRSVCWRWQETCLGMILSHNQTTPNIGIHDMTACLWALGYLSCTGAYSVMHRLDHCTCVCVCVCLIVRLKSHTAAWLDCKKKRGKGSWCFMRKWQQNRMQVHIQINHAAFFFFLFVLCEEVLGVHYFDL